MARRKNPDAAMQKPVATEAARRIEANCSESSLNRETKAAQAQGSRGGDEQARAVRGESRWRRDERGPRAPSPTREQEERMCCLCHPPFARRHWPVAADRQLRSLCRRPNTKHQTRETKAKKAWRLTVVLGCARDTSCSSARTGYGITARGQIGRGSGSSR